MPTEKSGEISSRVFIKKKINGKCLDLLKNIYKRSKRSIIINNKWTNFFDHEKDVRQGDPLSPTLFNIFINDLFKELNTKGIK